MSTTVTDTIVRYRSMPAERTPQRLDPIGVQSAWLLIPLLGVVAVGYAIASTIWHRAQLVDPVLAVVAVGLLALAAAVATIRSHPGLAPIGRWSHFAVVGVTIVAGCLFEASVWGRNERIQDDWGQIAVALFLIAMPLYRPVAEVLAVALVGAVVLGALAAAQAPSILVQNNPLVYATVAATPVLALAAGGSGYAWTMTGETLRWRELARAGQARLDGELRQAAARMVAQERATELDAEALPFLAGLLASGEIGQEDRERAGRIADRVRAAAVDAIERTWLAETIALALARRGVDPAAPGTAARVDDPDGLDRVLSEEQRAVVGALAATVARLPALDPATLRVEVSQPEHPVFLITAHVTAPRRRLRPELLPFLSALRSVSMEASMRVREDELTVRFAYPGGRNR